MKMKIIVASVALLAVSGSAYAQGYLGFGVLRGNISVPSMSGSVGGVAVTGSGDNTSDTGFKLFGGYNFTPNWGAEAAYNDFGNSYSMKGTIGAVPYSVSGSKAKNWSLAGVGTLPLSNEFSVFGKLGWAWNDSNGGTATSAGTSVTLGSNRRSQPLYGVGASYAFTKNWAGRLEYEDFGKVTQDDVWGTGGSGAIKANAWSLSVKYSF